MVFISFHLVIADANATTATDGMLKKECDSFTLQICRKAQHDT